MSLLQEPAGSASSLPSSPTTSKSSSLSFPSRDTIGNKLAPRLISGARERCLGASCCNLPCRSDSWCCLKCSLMSFVVGVVAKHTRCNRQPPHSIYISNGPNTNQTVQTGLVPDCFNKCTYMYISVYISNGPNTNQTVQTPRCYASRIDRR